MYDFRRRRLLKLLSAEAEFPSAQVECEFPCTPWGTSRKSGVRCTPHLPVAPPLLGRQTLFFLEKLATFIFSHHRLSVLQCRPYLFSPEKLATFFAHHCRFYSFHSFTRVSPIISGMQKIAAPLVGAPFLWGPLYGRTC